MSIFLNKESWKNIERSYIFDAAMYYPSDTKRPLSFFVPDKDDENRGSIVTGIGDFKPKRINGRMTAVEQTVIVKLKPRKVIILSHNIINHNTSFEFILVAPIMSISSSDQRKKWFHKMLNDEHPFFLYLPEEITGRECYVDLSELTSIHKGMLLNKHNKLNEERENALQELLSDCLDLGLVDEDESIDSGAVNE